MVQSLAIIRQKSYLMKQIIIFINRLVSTTTIAMGHKFMAPGSNSNEPVLAVIRVKSQQRFPK